MKYIVQMDGKEFGPVDEITLTQWVEEGRVLRTSKVRNSMIIKWNDAGTLDLLAKAFEEREAENEEAGASGGGFFGIFGGGKNKRVEEKVVTYDSSSAFKQHYLPNPAPISLRLLSALFDLIVSYLIIMLSIIPGYVMTSAGFETSTAFYFSFFIAFCGIVGYLAGCIGVFAQTFGMWFWGLMVTENNSKASPVYLFNAYIFALMLLLFGVLSPLFVYLNANRRSLHEIMTGTQVIRIAAKPKA